MTTCTEVATFLEQASAKSTVARLPPEDLTRLVSLNLVRQLSAADLAATQERVEQIQSAQAALAQEAAQRQQTSAAMAVDSDRSHSILFHLEGVDRQHALLERLQQEGSALKNLDEDLAKRQQEFAQLLLDKSLLDAVGPYDAGYLAVTTQGRMVLRDLESRLYRVGDLSFASYWDETTRISNELVQIAQDAARLMLPLSSELSGIERSYLWAVAIGLVKVGGDPQQRLEAFHQAYHAIEGLSDNLENRLMSAEILSVSPHPIGEAVQHVEELAQEVHDLNVPDDARLGVASILFLGERADGTYALDPLHAFLTKTPSFESAALLAIQNRPFAELEAKFEGLRALFGSWGYSASEDTELSSAYLAASDLPTDAVSPKLALLSRGLSGYLQFPLVAASILATIPVLEANETLNLLEKAYEILGQRTGPMSQAELICLAVRTIHGIDVRSVDELDATARAVPAPPTAGFSYVGVPVRLWMPVFVVHGAYYSTFSGIGGYHPGHVHVWGGGGFTG